MSTDRREFLKLLGLGGAAAVVAPHVHSEPTTSYVESMEDDDFEDEEFDEWAGYKPLPDNTPTDQITIKYGIFMKYVDPGKTPREYRNDFKGMFGFSSHVLAYDGVTRLPPDIVRLGGTIEFIGIREYRVPELNEEDKHYVICDCPEEV